MPLFDVFVARRNCVTSVDGLKADPNVKRVINLPREWVLYEFHDQLFQDPDYLVEDVWERKMRDRPGVRAARINMLTRERELLAPWYEAENKLGDADLIAISEMCEYRIYSLNSLRTVEFEPAEGWGTANAFTIVLRDSTEQRSDLLKLVNEWELASENLISISEKLTPSVGEFRLKVKCSGYGGHWLVALWALMCDGRYKLDISKVTVQIDA